MRCLALAQTWQDAGCEAVFVMAESTPAIDERLRSERMKIVQLESAGGSAQDVQQLADLSRAEDAEWVVVDGYQFGADYQLGLKEAGLKLLFVDDIGECEHYYADIVLNQNAHASETMYKNRESYTRLLLGPGYAMLRREFKSWREWKREIPAVAKKILFTIGGSDPDGLTLRLVNALPKICNPDLEATVVVGGSNPCMTELRQEVAAMGARIHFVSNAWNMPELMAESDIAVVCGGGTLWELLYMGCATFSYSRNAVQGKILVELSATGAACNLGAVNAFQEAAFASAIDNLASSYDRRDAMARTGKRMVDAEGTSRVLRFLAEPATDERPSIIMSPVKASECDEFLEMAERHFRELNPGFAPDPDWQKSYFENIKKNSAFSLYWIVVAGHRSGFILFGVEEHRFLPRKTGIIWELYINPDQRRQGLARLAAEYAIRELRRSSPSKIQLEVIQGNTAAAELWKSLGFQKVTERFVLSEKSERTK
jgi:UDP-2,4-diacetamido-2,4,6-trideoxy-beta-L-altropyranose hydrolase